MQRTEQRHFGFLYKHTGSSRILNPQVQYIVSRIEEHYREEKKPKAGGGFRTLNKPSDRLKEIQRRILKEIKEINAERHIIPKGVFGLGGNDIKENVLPHIQNRHIFKIDIKNFFDSVNYEKVKMAFKTLGCNDEEAEILTRLCTYNYCIPQGVPTSSMLASICLGNCDRRIENLCEKVGMVYTRYADDITISCKNRITDETQRNIKKIIKQEGFRMNEKTRIIDTRSEPCEITGVILQNGRMITKYHPGQEKHDFIKEKMPITQSERDPQLHGVLEWIRNTDPEHYHRLTNNQRTTKVQAD